MTHRGQRGVSQANSCSLSETNGRRSAQPGSILLGACIRRRSSTTVSPRTRDPPVADERNSRNGFMNYRTTRFNSRTASCQGVMGLGEGWGGGAEARSERKHGNDHRPEESNRRRSQCGATTSASRNAISKFEFHHRNA